MEHKANGDVISWSQVKLSNTISTAVLGLNVLNCTSQAKSDGLDLFHHEWKTSELEYQWKKNQKMNRSLDVTADSSTKLLWDFSGGNTDLVSPHCCMHEAV